MTSCYNTNAELKLIKYIKDDVNLMFITEAGKCAIINTGLIPSKENRGCQGNMGIKIKQDDLLVGVAIVDENSNIEIESTKGVMHIKLSDMIDSNRSKFEYYSGSCGNVGKMIYRNKHTKTVSMKVE